jgi:hypothetical protein
VLWLDFFIVLVMITTFNEFRRFWPKYVI